MIGNVCHFVLYMPLFYLYMKWGFHGLMNLGDKRHKTDDLFDLKKYLVGANNLLSLPTNIDNLSTVLCSSIRH